MVKDSTIRGANMYISKKKALLFLLLLLGVFLPLGQAARAEGAQISGIAWLEKTVDGAYNNESGLAGVTITLAQRQENGEEKTLASVTTEKDGAFAFSVSEAGEYRLLIDLPDGYYFTLPGTASAALPAQGSSSATPYFSLTEGQFAVKNIGACRASAAVTAIAFEDENANGGRMSTEPLVRNMQVDLVYEYGGELYVVASGKTDKTGTVTLRNVSPCDAYRLRAWLPEHYAAGPLGQKVSVYYNCVSPYDGESALSAPFTAEVKKNAGLGVGVVKTGALEGKIWLDESLNGQLDSQEPGLSGATVSLSSLSTPGFTLQTVSDAEGNYSFSRLQPGDYRLDYTLPGGMMFTYGESLITDAAAQGSLQATVQADVTLSLQPIGAMPVTSLLVRFYQDLNCNGVWDAEEPAFLEGASLSVLQDDALTGQAEADASGAAAIAILRGGAARLRCTLPQGFVFTGSQDSFLSFAPGALTGEGDVTLAHGQDNSLTVGVTAAAAISGALFEDPANTGVYQSGYAFLEGFEVQAVNDAGEIAATALTDAEGRYELAQLAPGSYTVHFLLKDPYVAAPYAADQPGETMTNHILSQSPAYGETEPVALASGQRAEHLDGAVFRAGVISGSVLVMPDGASAQGGLAGAVVTLLDEHGAPYSDYTYSVTDAEGRFLIKGVLPGAYSLLYELPQDAAFTAPYTEQTEWESDSFQIGSGTEISMPDVGAVLTATLSGHVLERRGGVDFPIAATLTLSAQDGDAVYETGALDDGQYVLEHIRPGAYTLSVSLPEGYVFAYADNALISGVSASSAAVEISLAQGELLESADFSAAQPVSFPGLAFYDADQSASPSQEENAAANREFSLLRGENTILALTSDENGNFALENIIPGSYTLYIPLEQDEILVGYTQRGESAARIPLTFESGDAPSTVLLPFFRYGAVEGQIWCMDGSQNGVSGLTVSLCDEAGNALATAVTDETGAYGFDGLTPGVYTLQAELPQGYLYARAQDAESRSSFLQSRADGETERLPIALSMGDELSGIDIGMGAMGTIGDFAWLDKNGNGMQDLDEPGVPGIQIFLYQHGELAASAETDAYGHYQLTGLYPGEYEMRVVLPAELKTTLCQTEFPLVASILPQGEEGEATAQGVIVPSGGTILHYDLGFQLKKAGVYPASMENLPQKDWTPYADR